MKALFGVVSMLVALAIVGLVMVKQLRAVGHGGAASADAAAVAAPSLSGSGPLRSQALELENRVAGDAVKAMEQGARAHSEAAERAAQP
jgi:hypothetical protein